MTAAHQRYNLGFAAAELSRLVRMQTDAEPQRGPQARQFSCALGFGRVFRRKDAERVRQSGRLGSLNDVGQVFDERVVCQMAM